MVSSDYLPTYANLPHFQYAQLRVTDLNLFPRRVARNQTTDPTEGCPWCPVLFNIHAVSVPNRNPHLNSPLVRLEGSLRYLGQILLPCSCARDLNQASSSANIPKFDQVRRVSPWRARPIGPSVGHLLEGSLVPARNSPYLHPCSIVFGPKKEPSTRPWSRAQALDVKGVRESKMLPFHI